MGKDARLAEKTVKKATRVKTTKKRATRKRDTYSQVVTKLDLRIHDQRVAKTARSLAGGDLLRIEQLGVNDLVVHNNHNWRKKQ